MLAVLRHPAIPRYLEYFERESESDRLFHIAQVVAPGRPLQALCAAGWRPTQAEAEAIVRQLLEARSPLAGSPLPPTRLR